MRTVIVAHIVCAVQFLLKNGAGVEIIPLYVTGAPNEALDIFGRLSEAKIGEWLVLYRVDFPGPVVLTSSSPWPLEPKEKPKITSSPEYELRAAEALLLASADWTRMDGGGAWTNHALIVGLPTHLHKERE